MAIFSLTYFFCAPAFADSIKAGEQRHVYEKAGYKKLTASEVRELHNNKILTFKWKGKNVRQRFNSDGVRIVMVGGGIKTKWALRGDQVCYDSARGSGVLCYEILHNGSANYIYCDVDEAPICGSAVIKVE